MEGEEWRGEVCRGCGGGRRWRCVEGGVQEGGVAGGVEGGGVVEEEVWCEEEVCGGRGVGGV